jgi:hypothetical protein
MTVEGDPKTDVFPYEPDPDVQALFDEAEESPPKEEG